MAITNGYATLAEVKANLGITDTNDDTKLEAVIYDVSRAIDSYTRRHFYTTTGTETRYFTPITYKLCIIEDLNTLSTLSQDDSGARAYSVTWASTDYDLLPDNASLDGQPYTAIQVTPDGDYTFNPSLPRSVKIEGKFGWATVPGEVHAACCLWSERLFKRKDAVFGVLGAGGMGALLAIGEMDPDVKRLLGPPIRRIA